jgi:hypothetical protein
MPSLPGGMGRDGLKPILREMSAAVDSRRPKRLDLLLVYCSSPVPRRPVFERLREKIGAELARLLVFALSGNQRARSARRG